MPKKNSTVDMSHFGVVDQAVDTMRHVASYISVGMEMTLDVASDLKTEHEKDKDGDCEDILKEVMTDYIQMERDFNQFIESVQFMKKKVEEGADYEKLEEILEERVNELKSQNYDSLIKQHEKYVDLIEKIQEVRNEEPINTELRAITQGTEEDDDIQMTEENIVTKCPYTGIEMTNPMRNKVCGHNYERDGILEYIAKRKHKARCPVGGCNSSQALTQDDLEENKDLRKFIERKRRQEGKQRK